MSLAGCAFLLEPPLASQCLDHHSEPEEIGCRLLRSSVPLAAATTHLMPFLLELTTAGPGSISLVCYHRQKRAVFYSHSYPRISSTLRSRLCQQDHGWPLAPRQRHPATSSGSPLIESQTSLWHLLSVRNSLCLRCMLMEARQ